MRRRAALLTGAMALGLAVGPLGAAPASGASCSYQVQLYKSEVAFSRVSAPSGYVYADQPSSANPPLVERYFSGVVTAQGAGCEVGQTTIRLQSRDAGSRPFHTRRTMTTGRDGRFSFPTRPSRTAVVRVLATTPDGAEVVSEAIVAPVRALISATYTRGLDCSLFAAGSTFPAKPQQPIRLQIRIGQGFHTVASGLADSRGVYRIGWAAPCGKHDLVTYLPPTATNDAGRARYVRLRVEARH